MKSPFENEDIQKSLELEKLMNDEPLTLEELSDLRTSILNRILISKFHKFISKLRVDDVNINTPSHQNLQQLPGILMSCILHQQHISKKQINNLIHDIRIFELVHTYESKVELRLRDEYQILGQINNSVEGLTENIFDTGTVQFKLDDYVQDIRWKYFEQDVLNFYAKTI